LEGLSTITYRKHWVVLIEKTWLPNLILLALIGGLVYEIVHGVDALLIAWFLIFILTLGWWYYQYLDWSNDVFQVTPDQILDISKKPIGEVTSDIASLDNILHLEYERKGLLQILFNYGNVYITIGGGKEMTFENVFDPSAVQNDIERRRLERVAQKEQEAIKAERERVADWFAAYHRSSEELRQAEQEEGKPNETDVK
jgi:signal transduction histidine kinase